MRVSGSTPGLPLSQGLFIKDVTMRLRTELWVIFTFLTLSVTVLLADKQPAYLGNDHPANYSEKQKIIKRLQFIKSEISEVEKMIEQLKEGK
jgi:hypothetical protein